MLGWSTKALSSISVFFRKLQNIDIYIEDDAYGSEFLYKELINRLLDDKVKINKVFSLKGKMNVINHCKNHRGPRLALYIIDADITLLTNDKKINVPHLYQHDQYCIENYLFCKIAAIELIIESLGDRSREDVSTDLAWEKWTKNIEDLFSELFIIYAIAHKIAPDFPNVGLGISTLVKVNPSSGHKEIAPDLVQNRIDDLTRKIQTLSGKSKFEENYVEIKNIINSSSHKIKFISGKHYLIPILQMHFSQKYNIQLPKVPLYFRLAKNCDVSRLNKLKDALILTASGKIYINAN
jgi:hypothetical protein